MSGNYDRQGIQFLYPENWQITDEEVGSWPRTVSVQSPQGGFWSLMIYESDQDPEQLIEEVLSTMKAEYEDIEADQVDDEFLGIRTSGYEMLFYCLDFVVSARTLATRTGERTILMLWQAEDRDFEQLEPVFRAISTSFFQRRASSPALREGRPR